VQLQVSILLISTSLTSSIGTLINTDNSFVFSMVAAMYEHKPYQALLDHLISGNP